MQGIKRELQAGLLHLLHHRGEMFHEGRDAGADRFAIELAATGDDPLGLKYLGEFYLPIEEGRCLLALGGIGREVIEAPRAEHGRLRVVLLVDGCHLLNGVHLQVAELAPEVVLDAIEPILGRQPRIRFHTLKPVIADKCQFFHLPNPLFSL